MIDDGVVSWQKESPTTRTGVHGDYLEAALFCAIVPGDACDLSDGGHSCLFNHTHDRRMARRSPS